MRDMERFCHSKNRWLVKTVLLLLLLCTLFSTVTVASAETDLKALLDPLERETFPDKTSELAVTVRQAYLEDPAAYLFHVLQNSPLQNLLTLGLQPIQIHASKYPSNHF